MKTTAQIDRNSEEEKVSQSHKKGNTIMRLAFWWACIIAVLVFELMVM